MPADTAPAAGTPTQPSGPPTTEPIVSVRELSKIYRQGDINVTALDRVSLGINAGEFLVLMGPSGSGKSTLLHIIAGIDRPTSGEVHVQGIDISRLNESELADWRNRNVGFVFQSFNLVPVLTAFENVELPLLLTRLGRRERRRLVTTALELVGLAERQHHLPKQMSGGQEQRVAIARAIVTDPHLIVADEPTGNLDSHSAQEALSLLRSLSTDHGKTVIMVTHDPKAAAFGSRQIHLEKGELTTHPPPNSELRTPNSELRPPSSPMTLSGFILRNAFRNKRRALLSAVSVAASLFLLVTLQTFQREFTLPPSDVGASLRIAVRNKVSLGLPLPARQRSTIENIPGIAGLTPFTYFGGRFRDEAFTPFAQFAVDPLAFTNVFVDAKTPPEQLATWFENRRSCIIGKVTMDRYGLKVGDKLKLTGTFYPVDLDLDIAGYYAGTPDDRSVFFHHKHLDEMLGGGQTVGTWWVRAASAEAAPGVISAINAAFVNTSAEVRAETESAFQMGFVSMWGNIKLLIGSISSVVVFTLLLVAVSTMSMAIRERFRELAILKAIGYRRRELFGFILAESFGLAMVGAILGAGGAWLVYSVIDLPKLTGGMLRQFEVTDRILALGFTVAAALGILAAIPPAIAVARTSVVDGLKTLD